MSDRPVVADRGYGDATAFRLGLDQWGLSYVVAVKASTSAQPYEARVQTPEWAGTGRPRTTGYPEKPGSLRELAISAGRRALRQVTWLHGSKKTPRNRTGSMCSRFLALRVRPANHQIPRNTDGSLPETWMLAEWPPNEPEPTDYWLSNLDAKTSLRELVGLAKLRWRVEHDYRELTRGLGLDHFEGRSLPGWYRPVTLASLAQAICTQLRYDPKAPAPAQPCMRSSANSRPSSGLDRRLPHLPTALSSQLATTSNDYAPNKALLGPYARAFAPTGGVAPVR